MELKRLLVHWAYGFTFYRSRSYVQYAPDVYRWKAFDISASHNTHSSTDIYFTSLQHIWSIEIWFNFAFHSSPHDQWSLFFLKRNFSNDSAPWIGEGKKKKNSCEAQLFTHVYTKRTQTARCFILLLQAKHVYVTREHETWKKFL